MCFRYIHPYLLNRRLEIYKRFLARVRKRFRPGSASLALNHVVLPSSKYCLDFKTINMFFVYPVTNITIHALNKLFLTIFWCISAVETTMPWCKRSKKEMMSLYILRQINAQGYIGALT